MYWKDKKFQDVKVEDIKYIQDRSYEEKSVE
jgi:hypothetical protein